MVRPHRAPADDADAARPAGDDSTDTRLESEITAWTAQRDALARQIKAALNGADFAGATISQHEAQSLAARAQALIRGVEQAAQAAP